MRSIPPALTRSGSATPARSAGVRLPIAQRWGTRSASALLPAARAAHQPGCAGLVTLRSLRSRSCGACGPEGWLPLRSSHPGVVRPKGRPRCAGRPTGLRPGRQG